MLGKVSGIVIAGAIEGDNQVMRRRGKDMLTLLERRWNDEIAKISRVGLGHRKWNKPQLLPLTEDLQNLKCRISTLQNISIMSLKKDMSNLNAWRGAIEGANRRKT